MTDKVELGYLPTYRKLAEELESTWNNLHVLEIGIAAGGGMDLFSEIFYTDHVYGVDIKPESGRPEQWDRIVTSAQDDPGLPLVLASNGWAPFDLIVDDASHLAGPSSVTLINLWPLVRAGGFYVIEDWNYFEGPGMASNLWQKLLGSYLAHPGVGDPNRDNPYSGMLPDVDNVTIRDGMIIARKS